MGSTITPGKIGDWLLEVAAWADGVEPTAWTPVRGLTEFTPPAIEKNLEDDGDFDGDDWGSQIATGISYTAEGTVKRPRGSATPDPGQDIMEASGLGTLEAGFIHFRYSDKTGDGSGKEGIADCTFTENGGPKTDLKTAAFTLTGRGALVDFPVPAP